MDDGDEEIGYRKPPKKHRFPKGKSGNPNGRPPKKVAPKRSLTEIIEHVLDEELEFEIRGVTKRITYREMICRQLLEKAAEGDKSALQLLYGVEKHRQPSFEPTPEDEEELQQALRERYSIFNTALKDDENGNI
jgi:hypothetical protein